MHGTSSSDRETNGRVSGRAGDLAAGFGPPLRLLGWGLKSYEIGTLASHTRAKLPVTLSARVEGVTPPLKGGGARP
jgi:hypothetical protein